MNLKNSGDSTGFEPMTSAMPVQCSNQLSYEVTQWRAGQFVGLMFSRERNVIWKKCYMQCGVWNQMKIWSSHLLDKKEVMVFVLAKYAFVPDDFFYLTACFTRTVRSCCCRSKFFTCLSLLLKTLDFFFTCVLCVTVAMPDDTSTVISSK